jgi:hypothetical protein
MNVDHLLVACWVVIGVYALFEAFSDMYPDILLSFGYWLRERGEAVRQYGRRLKLRG